MTFELLCRGRTSNEVNKRRIYNESAVILDPPPPPVLVSHHIRVVVLVGHRQVGGGACGVIRGTAELNLT